MDSRKLLRDAITSHSDVHTLRMIIEKGVNLDEYYIDGMPLHHAVDSNNLPVVELLLAYKADVNCKGLHQQTPLNYAAIGCSDTRYDMCKLLLENGADCNGPDNDAGFTPFHRALAYAEFKVVKLFLHHGADISMLDAFRRTALHWALMNPNVDVLKLVLDQNVVDVNQRNRYGSSPLHSAVFTYNRPDACEHLLRHGADVDQRERYTWDTPLYLAIKSNSKTSAQVVQVLLGYGAKIVGETFQRISASEPEATTRKCFRWNIGDVLIQHIVKMECLNSSNIIDEDDLRIIRETENFKQKYQMCHRELHKMTQTKFYDNVSIFNVWTANEEILSAYAKNKDLIMALTEKNYDDEFPIYLTWLQRNWFYAKVRKQRLQNEAAKSLRELFQFNDPSHLVNMKILSFLEEKDLRHLEM